MGTLKHDLCAGGLELIETHISWVFLGKRDVWKVEKPVSLGFLDVARWEPVVELPPHEHVILDAEQPLSANVSQLRAALPTWPPEVGC